MPITKLIALAVLTCFVPVCVAQAASFVQVVSKNAGSATSFAFPSLTNVATSDLLVAGGLYSSSATSSVTDSFGNTWHLIQSSTNQGRIATWYTITTKGGNDTVTWHLSTSHGFTGHVAEYTGINTSTPLDSFTQSSTASANESLNSGATSTNYANDLIVGLGGNYNSDASATPGVGFTMRATSTIGGFGQSSFIEDESAGAAGSYSATATSSLNLDWFMTFQAFQSSTSTPIASPPHEVMAAPIIIMGNAIFQ